MSILTRCLSPSAAGGSRESGRADQQGREPALLPAGRTVEPLPGRRRAQPPHPVLPGPGAPHAQGKSGGGGGSRFIRGALTQFSRVSPELSACSPSRRAKTTRLNLASGGGGLRGSTKILLRGFITIGILFLPAAS